MTFTAVVTGLGGTPGGTVTFSDGGTAIGTATLSAGVATITTTTLAAGSHSIMASYGGGANFNPSASQALAQTVEYAVRQRQAA
ncbi:Ig-like domain-containing protein [Bradyrhizobium septentrionale]|uniref:Ig-like domain-containing protein n=1 Tax=Bradyrhizobium septentrionale TaxID=1404411 RepID=UPI0030846B71